MCPLQGPHVTHSPSLITLVMTFSFSCILNPIFTELSQKNEAHCHLHIPLLLSPCFLQLFRARSLSSSRTAPTPILGFSSQPLHLHVAKPLAWAQPHLTGWSKQQFIEVGAFCKCFLHIGSGAPRSLSHMPPLHQQLTSSLHLPEAGEPEDSIFGLFLSPTFL